MNIYQEITLHELWLRTDGRRGRKADFSNCDLRNVDFDDRNLSFAIFDHTDLSGAMMDSAQFDRASFKDARLVGVHGIQASFIFADLQGANLSESLWEQANFDKALFDSRTKFARANMQRAVIPSRQRLTVMK